jgi:hypothetical protein
MERLDIVLDIETRVVVDDVSEGTGKEFRSSVYDLDGELLGEGWGETVAQAVAESWADFLRENADV